MPSTASYEPTTNHHVFEESHPKIGTKTATEATALWHLAATAVVTAWLAGGAAVWAAGFIITLGVIGIGIFFVHRLRGNFRNHGNLRRYILFLLPPAAAIVLFITGIFDQPMETIIVGGREMVILSPAATTAVVNMAPLNGWVPLLVYCLIYISVLNIWFIFESRWTIKRLLNVILISTAFLSALGLMQMLLGADKVFGIFTPPGESFFSTFPHSDLWTPYALAVFGLGLAITHLTKFRQSWRYFLTSREGLPFYLSCLIGVTVLIQSTPYGMIGLLVITALFFCFEAAARGRSSRSSALWAVTYSAVALILIAAAIYTGATRLPTLLNEPISPVTETSHWQERSALWRDSMVAIRQRPLFGWGVGSYPLVFAFFQEVDLRGGFYAHPRSSIVNLLVERGIVGAALWALPILLLVAGTPLREMRNFSQFLVLLALLMLIPGILSYAFASPAYMLLFWIVIISGCRWITVEKDTRIATPTKPSPPPA